MRVQRQGMIQPVLLEFRHEKLYWSWRVRAWHALEEIAAVLVQVEESWMWMQLKVPDEDYMLIAEETIVLEAEARAQGLIVQEMSALERQAGDPYY